MFLAMIVTAFALWVLLALILATVIGRAAGLGEYQHQMDGLYRSVRRHL